MSYRLLLVLSAVALSFTSLSVPALPQASRAARPTAELQLRILETSDLHMNLLAYDYYQDKPSREFGLAATMSLIKAARQEQANTLLFDNGDLLQGTPLGDLVAKIEPLPPGTIHPAYKLLNALQVDAANLGNHDFNYGLPFLRQTLAGARFPTLNANLLDAHSGKPAFQPSAVLQRRFVDAAGRAQPLRIGVIGLAPPQVMQWDRQHLQGRLRAIDMVEAARQQVQRLRAAGVDLIIAIAHSGYEAGPQGEMAENRAGELAQLPGIDLLLLGHAHSEFPGPGFARHAGADVARGTIHGKPAVMPGRWGDHLGVIDLRLRREAGRWRIVDSRSELRAIYDRQRGQALVEADPWAATLIAEEHQRTLNYVRREVARSELPLHSFFAQVRPSLPVQLVARAQAAFVRRALIGSTLEGLPILSAAAPFKAGGARQGWRAYTDIPAGPLAIKHVADLYLYPNTIKVLKLTGAELREWLERSAAQFRTIDPAGRPEQALLDEDYPSFNFDSIDGLQYAIDVSRPPRYATDGSRTEAPGARIVTLCFQGRAIDDSAEFLLVTNNYRAAGGGRFPAADARHLVLDLPDENREALAHYLSELGTFKGGRVDAEPSWQVLPVPGVKLAFRSADIARERLDRDGPVQWLRDAADGSAWFELAEQPRITCR
ncbi:bifunctional 2',3'-cyclic-nucleotide 2'-phosphodiesterase/3'-nucleotidase [Paucibacter sp. APW11]|uniref:Bifunctional 2',3'-cyclic-nucleotide 2'-phosphodiesterase/3'-nucleotidase n=1 Tax=Roseateles aquae TaxID=3077235 RepID=A0ABU3P8J3_9BURK|nr:bifunctional 2',3'-cyclic-nucleotide 2'-phosphodiesterase/3'-nucleotidase [Paucibacter sp. APW11]MDT8998885.1 bifunctional 2',3'-cyclic-nucleotide 2'-phosphodiesterase/3'-nucleotidase [Paucibacter sp. APW11]